MRSKFVSRFLGWVSACGLLAAPATALAVDGVIEINQASALAGGVTPGDAPGFPVSITRSGSYRLTGNLDVAVNDGLGISIGAADVTLDLNGFAVTSPKCVPTPPRGANCGQAGGIIGIDVRGRGAVVRNGAIRGFSLAGIRASNDGLTARDLRFRANGTALECDVGFCVAEDCTAEFGNWGFNGGGNAQANGGDVAFTRCMAGSMSEAGFLNATRIESCSASRNSKGFQNSHAVYRSSAIGNLTGIENASLVQDSVIVSNQVGLVAGFFGATTFSGSRLHNTVNLSGAPFLQLGPNVCGNALCP